MKSYRDNQLSELDKARESENLFCELSGAKRGTQQDDFNHVDCWLDGVSHDVKGNKRSNGKGYVLVELKNVNGKSGWCSRSGADKIAFQFDDEFVIVDNKKLYSFAKSKVIEHHNPKRPVWRENGIDYKHGYSTICYKALGRKKRLDVFIYVKKQDVIDLCERVYLINPFYCTSENSGYKRCKKQCDLCEHTHG
jgi:hypothetical protein